MKETCDRGKSLMKKETYYFSIHGSSFGVETLDLEPAFAEKKEEGVEDGGETSNSGEASSLDIFLSTKFLRLIIYYFRAVIIDDRSFPSLYCVSMFPCQKKMKRIQNDERQAFTANIWLQITPWSFTKIQLHTHTERERKRKGEEDRGSFSFD